MVCTEVAGQLQRFVAGDKPTMVDFFAGGGGGSLGGKLGGFDVIAALNHNQTCIDTHRFNFQGVRHVRADIFKASPKLLPTARVGWFSPSCVFFSIARGGRPCNEQERAHAEQMPRFCFALNLEVVYVENVREYRDWGPLTEKRDKQGNIVRVWNEETQEWDVPLVPDKARKGEYYRRWLRAMQEMGYTNYEYRLLNAADYGAPQSRLRYFSIFTRGEMPIVWPAPTHDEHGRHGLPRWRGAGEVLQLQQRGRSIFNRTRTSKKRGTRPDPLADNTLRRIHQGLQREVARAVGKKSAGWGVPWRQVDRSSLRLALHVEQVIYQNNGTRANDSEARSVRSLRRPALAVLSNGGNQFLMTYYRKGGFRHMDEPAATVTTKDRIAKVAFLFAHQFTNAPRGLDLPARTVLASRRHPYLAQVSCEGVSKLLPQPGDSAVMLALKAFCLECGITDVFMRMLSVDELKLLMGFPADYHLLGTVTEQKKMLGNAVVPAVAAALARAMGPVLERWRGKRLPKLRRGVVHRWEQGDLFLQAA